MRPALDPGVVLDEDGLLRRGTRWVAIPAGLALVVQQLLDHLGSPVPIEQLIAAYAASGGTAKRSSVRVALSRLRRRVAPLGLELASIGQHGVVLRAASASPLP